MLLRGLLVTGTLFLGLACGSDHDHGHDEDQFICDGNEDSLAPGTTKTGAAGISMEIVEAMPPVHYVQNNELIVTVSDTSGLLDGVNFESILPFTAKHDHGTPVPAAWEATGNAGEYRLYDISYVHRGPWRVDIELSAGGVSDSLEWIFCIEDLPGTADAG